MLEVLVGAVADQTADEDDGVEADAEAGRVVVGSRGNGAGKGGLGLGVVGLCDASANRDSASSILRSCSKGAYVALQSANLELLKRLAGLVAVTDILEGLGGILTADVEKNLLATTIRKTAGLARVVVVVSQVGQCRGTGKPPHPGT